MFLTLAAAFFVFFVYHTRWIAPAETLAGADAEVSGTLCELPEARYGKYYYELDVDTIALADAPHVSKLRFSSKRLLSAEPYDRITCRLHFYLPAKGEGYSSRAYYASKGIPILAYLNEFTEPQYEPAGKKPLYAYALQLRQKTENALFSMLPDAQAGLLSGVLLGDKSSVPEETIDDFRRVGASHLLAVSGLHLTALLAALMAFLRKLHLPEPLCAGICMMGVVVFMAVTGFTASVLRSGIMYLIFLFAQIVNRKADSLSSLGAAVLILCLRSPYAAADVGLLLSVMATLGMILFSARLQKWMKNWISPENRPRVLRRIFEVLISVLSGTLASLALTLPVTILLFGEVSLSRAGVEFVFAGAFLLDAGADGGFGNSLSNSGCRRCFGSRFCGARRMACVVHDVDQPDACENSLCQRSDNVRICPFLAGGDCAAGGSLSASVRRRAHAPDRGCAFRLHFGRWNRVVPSFQSRHDTDCDRGHRK